MLHSARGACLSLGPGSPGDGPGSDLLASGLAPPYFISLISKIRVVTITLQGVL